MPPQPPLWLVSLVPCVIRRRWLKSIPILHTQKVGQFTFSLDRLFWFASYMLRGRPNLRPQKNVQNGEDFFVT